MNVMKRAWEIAREGQNKFGGNVKEYFAEALRMAWAEAKAPKKVELVTKAGSRNHKSWVAKITGTHPRWKFERTFVKEDHSDWVDKVFTLTDGIYNVCDAGDKRFVKVENGQIENIQEYEVLEMIA